MEKLIHETVMKGEYGVTDIQKQNILRECDISVQRKIMMQLSTVIPRLADLLVTARIEAQLDQQKITTKYREIFLQKVQMLRYFVRLAALPHFMESESRFIGKNTDMREFQGILEAAVQRTGFRLHADEISQIWHSMKDWFATGNNVSSLGASHLILVYFYKIALKRIYKLLKQAGGDAPEPSGSKVRDTIDLAQSEPDFPVLNDMMILGNPFDGRMCFSPHPSHSQSVLYAQYYDEPIELDLTALSAIAPPEKDSFVPMMQIEIRDLCRSLGIKTEPEFKAIASPPATRSEWDIVSPRSANPDTDISEPVIAMDVKRPEMKAMSSALSMAAIPSDSVDLFAVVREQNITALTEFLEIVVNEQPALLDRVFVFDGKRRSLLHHAASRNDRTSVEAVLALMRVGICARVFQDVEGDTPLHIACRKGCDRVVKALLTSVDPSEMKTASTKGNWVGAHAWINTPNKRGMTPLHSAVDHESPVIVEMLLARGARKDGRDRKGRTPVMLAKRRKNETLLELLKD